MNHLESNQFMCGVIEGFYGRPWTFEQRHRLIGWLKQFGLNTYCFGPKDDLKHRVRWRESLDPVESDDFEKLIDECRRNGIRFLYGISPGWDDHFSNSINRFDPHELVDALKQRFEQLLRFGCTGFAVQFDDVPQLSVEERRQLAVWHAETCNELHRWLIGIEPAAQLFMCPAVYCSAMATEQIDNCIYLRTLGTELDRKVSVFWTGPDIISDQITFEHLEEVAKVIKRPPVIWDNLNANDYDPSRPHLGPYSGRTSSFASCTSGILLNPNRQFELNFVPLFTLGAFSETGTTDVSAAVEAWIPEWERITGPPFSVDVVQRVVECFWLPHHNGSCAHQLLQSAENALSGNPQAITAIRREADTFGRLFFDLATLKNRDLLDALWSPVWRLKDELELIAQVAEKGGSAPVMLSDFPRGVVRGGLISRLQELIETSDAGYQAQA